MIRIVVLIALVVAIFAVRWFLTATPDMVSKRLKQLAWMLLVALLLGLMIAGKLNGLLALFGVMVAFFVRSLPVLLKYAPHIHSLWRHFKSAQSQQRGTDTQRNSMGAMSKIQAYEVLGLRPGASEEEIVSAHRKLISRLHPDRGGSDYLAAQINLAKKVLLGG